VEAVRAAALCSRLHPPPRRCRMAVSSPSRWRRSTGDSATRRSPVGAPPGHERDEEEDVDPLQEDGVDGHEVAGDRARRLRAQHASLELSHVWRDSLIKCRLLGTGATTTCGCRYFGSSLPLEEGLQLEHAEFLVRDQSKEAQERMFAYIVATEATGELPFLNRETYARALSTGRLDGQSNQ
jgi:hypothetical protein